MGSKLSPVAQQQLAQLELYTPRVMRLHSLVETFAVAKTNQENLNASIKRAADTLKLTFLTAGLAQMSQICGTLWLVAHRGGTQNSRTRAFREHIGALRFQLELESRTILREDQERRLKEGKDKQQTAH